MSEEKERVSSEQKELIRLPFGLFLGRKSTPTGDARVSMALAGKTGERASNSSESGTESVTKSLQAVSRSKERRINALSGAPDKRLAGGVEPPSPRNYGGRKTAENPNNLNVDGFGIWQTFAGRKTDLAAGLSPSFDLDSFSKIDIDKLSDLLADLSPEISKAVWDFVILSNSGYTLKAFRVGTEEIDQSAQDRLDEIKTRLSNHHGSIGVFFDRLFKMIFLRGAFLMELVLADNARDFVDVATPDTATLEFRQVIDPIRGQVWQFGQRIRGEFVELSNLSTIRYIPIHPNGNSIEGHSVCSSALFLAIFLMSVLRDIKRVVEHQGYLRLDVEVMFEKLVETIPEETRNDPEQLTAWMAKVIAAVEEVYSSLEPDDTYVHSDAIAVNNPVGAVNSDSLNALDALLQALERMAVRALKTMPLLLGTNQSRSETQANREWEIYAKGIETIQHYVETAFEYIATLALRAQGVQADVQLRFARFRAAEAMRDEQVDTIRAKRARYLYDCGYINQDEASQMATGTDKKADQTEPRNAFKPEDFGGGFVNENPNEGESRKPRTIGFFRSLEEYEAWLDKYLGERQPTEPELDEAEAFLDEFAPDDAAELFDAEVASDEEQAEIET